MMFPCSPSSDIKPSFWPTQDDDIIDDDDETEEGGSKSGGLVFLTIVSLVVPCVALLFAINKLAKMWRSRNEALFERSVWLGRESSFRDVPDLRDINVSPRRDSTIDPYPTRLHLSSSALTFDSEPPTRSPSAKMDHKP